MSKRKLLKLLLALIFIITGVMIFIYPRITDYIYKDKVTKLVTEFETKIETISKTEDNTKLNALYELLKQENEKVYAEKEWEFLTKKTYDITKINLSNYGFKDNIFGFLEVPSISITLPIYFGSSEENMRLGATHLTGTSYPIGGTNTNSVIAAHRGFFKTEMFRHIDKIKVGDKLYITNPFEKLTYEAYKMVIIKPEELNKLTITEGEDLITLVSCHPFPHNYERYVVYFKRI